MVNLGMVTLMNNAMPVEDEQQWGGNKPHLITHGHNSESHLCIISLGDKLLLNSQKEQKQNARLTFSEKGPYARVSFFPAHRINYEY